MKQRFVSIARMAGVLPLVDAARFWREKRRRADENRIFLRKHPGFEPPPLWWMHDMYRHTSYRLYWGKGLDIAASFSERIDAHVKAEHLRVAEWGCGLGRILRHMPDRYEKTGFDYNADAIDWCSEHIKNATFFHNDLMPPLPAAAASFDSVYAFSVFTHLSPEAHDAWIADIARVLAPGGVFFALFHMKPRPGQLLPEEEVRFARGELVTRGGVKEGSRTYVAYHPESWLRHHLFHGWEILEGPVDFHGQSLIAARRP